jgi:predicted Zn-dependent protease
VQKIFSTHPPTNERLQDVAARIAQRKPPAGLVRDSQRFQDVKRRLGGS